MLDYFPSEHKKKEPCPYVAHVAQCAVANSDFRRELWTGCYAQMTLMSIPVCSDIGLEIHKENDQIIRVEQGIAMVKIGTCKQHFDFQTTVQKGDVIFIPAGYWHNIINTGGTDLKLSSVYAPPHHPVGTVHHTKEDSEY